MPKKLVPWDSSKYLGTEEDIAAYLGNCAVADDPLTMVIALGNVARARNMSALARQIGMTREGLYKALSPAGNPSFATISKVANALGYPLSFQIDDVAQARKAASNDVRTRVRSHRQAEVQRKALALIDATVATATRLRESLLELAGDVAVDPATSPGSAGKGASRDPRGAVARATNER